MQSRLETSRQNAGSWGVISRMKQMKYPDTEISLTNKPKTRLWLAAFIGCSALALPGCGIPKLRCALSGPAMPQYYSLNNGAMLSNPQGGVSPEAAMEIDEGSIDAPEQIAPPENGADASEDNSARSEELLNSNRLPRLTSSADGVDFDAPGNFSAPENATSISTSAHEVEHTAASLSQPPSVVPAQALESAYSIPSNSSQLPLSAFFDDPFLIGLISQAMSGNQELRILSEEINIANNEVYARSGEYRPFVTWGAGAGIEKSSRFTRDGAVEDQLEGAPGRGFPEPLPDFLVATNVSWELDVWKKLRNSQRAACMRYLGSRAGRNYIVTRLVAEVAENYYELLALDNRLVTLQQTIEIQMRSLQVAEGKKAAGRGTELAVQRFQAEVRKNQSELLIIQQEIVEVENRINFLVGRYPQPVERASANYVDLNLTTLSAGLPAELLRNRADIRQAEREVAAAGLDVQVARARFYPSFGLNAGVGLRAFNTRYLLSTPESLIYNAALDVVGPLINRRAIKADYCSANAAQLQSIYHYQQTVLTAHIEVVNYLTKVENYRQSIETKKQQIEALEASVDAANKLFQSARAEYVEVLLAQREMMEARMVLIEIKQQQLQATVNAYQALGGGGF